MSLSIPDFEAIKSLRLRPIPSFKAGWLRAGGYITPIGYEASSQRTHWRS